MNKELETLGVDAIKGLLDTLTTAKAFAIEQAPEVVREIVLLGRIQYTVLAAFGFILTVAFGVCAVKGRSWRNKWLAAQGGSREEREASQISDAYGMACMPFAAVGLPCFFMGTYDAFLVWFAPRLYIIQTLKDML